MSSWTPSLSILNAHQFMGAAVTGTAYSEPILFRYGFTSSAVAATAVTWKSCYRGRCHLALESSQRSGRRSHRSSRPFWTCGEHRNRQRRDHPDLRGRRPKQSRWHSSELGRRLRARGRVGVRREWPLDVNGVDAHCA